ncbi:unnamed protein product [Chrysoparadoxa australica]
MAPMKSPPSYEQMLPIVQHEYFDHRAVPQLEEYLKEQVNTNTYDFEANKALLKLYQFFPDLCNTEMVALVMAKATMNLPRTDLLALSYFVPEQATQNEPVSALKKSAVALESAKFAEFWGIVSTSLESFLAKVPGFKEQIRLFIASALSVTFQSIARDAFAESLGLTEPAQVDAFVKDNSEMLSASPDGKRIKFQLNEFNQSQPKRFRESIEFDRILRVVQSLQP